MSPPIYTPDGSDVTEVVLPDGSTASEVVAPDGSVVFEAGPDIPDSGVSRWTFDNEDTESGTAIDSWGSNDGTINGATTGVSGANQTYSTAEAYSFDGNDDVDFGDISEVKGVSEVSISAWVKPSSSSVAGIILGSYPSADNALFIAEDDGGYWARVENSNTRAEIRSGSFNTGVWQHWIATYNSGELTLYIDGSEFDTDTGGPSVTSGSIGDIYAGLGTSGSYYFEGDQDDLRIYSKELTATEASNLYNTGSIDG